MSDFGEYINRAFKWATQESHYERPKEVFIILDTESRLVNTDDLEEFPILLAHLNASEPFQLAIFERHRRAQAWLAAANEFITNSPFIMD